MRQTGGHHFRRLINQHLSRQPGSYGLAGEKASVRRVLANKGFFTDLTGLRPFKHLLEFTRSLNLSKKGTRTWQSNINRRPRYRLEAVKYGTPGCRRWGRRWGQASEQKIAGQLLRIRQMRPPVHRRTRE